MSVLVWALSVSEGAAVGFKSEENAVLESVRVLVCMNAPEVAVVTRGKVVVIDSENLFGSSDVAVVTRGKVVGRVVGAAIFLREAE